MELKEFKESDKFSKPSKVILFFRQNNRTIFSDNIQLLSKYCFLHPDNKKKQEIVFLFNPSISHSLINHRKKLSMRDDYFKIV